MPQASRSSDSTSGLALDGTRPAGTLTFLFSDIEGSTRLEQAVGTRAYAVLRERHRALLRAAFAANDGAEQGTEGDSFFVAFRSARSALAAAVAAQRALATEPWPEGSAVRVRMGVHSGEPDMAGGSLVGIDINRAARIASAAHGGQVVVSDVTRSLVRGDASDGIGFRDLGSHHLKDLPSPERLHQVLAPGLREDFPPVRSLDTRPNTLPTQLTSFVGREAELAEVTRLLAGTRLLTMTGPGGTGKTRLAIRAASAVADDFPDGLFFVALDALRDAGLVPSQIAAALGITEAGGRPTEQLLADWLAAKTVLLVLDNFEQVVAAAPAVASLLRSAPGVKAIATSRAPLRVSGEHEYPVPGLPAPPDLEALPELERARLPLRERKVEVDALATYESVRLFVARATAVRPDFSVTNDNAPAVAAICARLRGMPLAIELAAARVRLLSPDAILSRLNHQLGALGSGSRDLPERQQTLRGAIAWSYDLLEEGERRLLERLSVFRGGIDLAAAEEVCGSPDLGRDVLDGLGELADQSLIRVLEGGEPRFAMLDTIREFAGEQLDARPEATEVRTRYRTWFLALARQAAPELMGSDQRTWLDRLEVEHDNLRAAMERAAADEDAETAIGIAFALWRFWQMRGHLTEARRRLDAMAATPWSRREPELRARLMEALGGVCWWQGDIAPMRAPYGEAVEVWREIGDRHELANALYNYSFSFSFQGASRTAIGDIDPSGEGEATLAEALALYRELGDEPGEANVLWGLGNLHYFKGELEASAAAFEAALPIHRRVGNQTMVAWSLHMLGSTRLQQGDLATAHSVIADALRLFHASGDAAGLTLVLDDFASLAAAAHDAERAVRLWGAARSLGDNTGTGLGLFVDETHDQFHRPTARGMVDEATGQRLAREGAAMTLDEVVAYALAGEPPHGD
jgi:predicted ATPase/class 3 adenylate cyclase